MQDIYNIPTHQNPYKDLTEMFSYESYLDEAQDTEFKIMVISIIEKFRSFKQYIKLLIKI